MVSTILGKFRTSMLAFVLFSLILFGATSALAVPSSFFSNNFNQAKVVTVGYYYSKNFQEGLSDSVVKSGYGYEYLQQVSDYTGWQYKYIYGDWASVYDRFLKGEIDVLAGLAYLEDRKSGMEYPDYFMDVDYHYIFVKEDDHSMSENNVESFNGKRIACLRNSNLTSGLIKWAEEKGAQLDYVYYNDISDMEAALKNGEVDGLVGNEKNVDRRSGFKPLALYAMPRSYICVRKGATRLLKELNAALARINSDDADVIDNLRRKYFRSNVARPDLSVQEQEWLKSHKTIRVGYAPDHLPYAATGHDGRVTGVIKDIMDTWLVKMDQVGKLQVKYKPSIDYARAIDDLQRGDVDIIFPVPSNRWYAEQSGLMASSEIVDISMSMIFKGEFNDSVTNRLALIARPMPTLLMREMFPKSEWQLYKTAEECVQAVLDGRATGAVITTFKANPLMRNPDYSQLKFMPLSETAYYSIGVKKGNHALLSLLNRGIGMMNRNSLNNAMYGYTDDHRRISLREFAHEHMVIVVLVVLLVVGAIIGFLILYILGVKSAQIESQIQVEFSEALSLEYPYAILIDIEKCFSVTIKRDGKVLKKNEQIYHENYYATLKNFVNNYVHKDDREETLRMSTLEVILENLKYKSEYTCSYRANWNGEEHYVQSSFVKIYSSLLKKNVIIEGCRTIDDIVKNERDRQELMANALAVAEHSNQSKTIFLNNMSHDIRTPMNAIIGFTNLAKSHIEDMDSVRGYLDKILRSSSHLLSLINNVLDMSRIESGKVKLNESSVHLPTIIREIQDMVQNTAQSKGVSISFFDSLSNEVVLADDLKIRQVLLNVVGNAIKFTPPGGEVTLSVIERDDAPEGFANYQFTISDTGIGMSSDFREHIFEAFSREKTSTVSGIQGTGLGMAISKNIVDMMGGTISVESTPHVGTKVIITLSLKFSTSTAKVGGEEEVTDVYAQDGQNSDVFDFSGKRILLVEDNLLNQEIAVSILKELRFEVDLACDGGEAVEKVRVAPEGTYCAILMDIQMPNMDGYVATRKIRSFADSSKSLIPIIALTANAFEEDRQKAFEAGMNGHVAKPISVPELMQVLGKLI